MMLIAQQISCCYPEVYEAILTLKVLELRILQKSLKYELSFILVHFSEVFYRPQMCFPYFRTCITIYLAEHLSTIRYQGETTYIPNK